ncbi:MAG: hypothetical protein ACK5MT_19995 [Actinomycetales bacterium]
MTCKEGDYLDHIEVIGYTRNNNDRKWQILTVAKWYPLGHPNRPYFGTNLLRRLETRTYCQSGPVLTERSAPFYETDTTLPPFPQPSECPFGLPTQILVVEMMVGQDGNEHLVATITPPAEIIKQDKRTPQCWDGSCRLEVWKTTTTPATNCSVAPHECLGWWNDLNRNDKYQCRYADAAVVMNECRILSYFPEAVTETPVPVPHTGDPMIPRMFADPRNGEPVPQDPRPVIAGYDLAQVYTLVNANGGLSKVCELLDSTPGYTSSCPTGHGLISPNLRDIEQTPNGEIVIAWLVSHLLAGTSGSTRSYPPVPKTFSGVNVDISLRSKSLAEQYDDSRLVVVSTSPAPSPADKVAAARQCIYVIGFVPNARDTCKDTPVFFSGQDIAEPTNHDIEATTGMVWNSSTNTYQPSTETQSWVLTPGFPDDPIAPSKSWYTSMAGPLFNPRWVVQNWEGGAAAGKPARTWYRTNPMAGPDGDGLDDDEFPLFTVEQGGRRAAVTPHIRPLDRNQNRAQGARFQYFATACQLQPGTGLSTLQSNNTGGDPLLFVPIPKSTATPTSVTFGVCQP